MGIGLYNKMPTGIEELEHFRDFKQRLKLLLLDHPFYSLLHLMMMMEEEKEKKKKPEPIMNNTNKTR